MERVHNCPQYEIYFTQVIFVITTISLVAVASILAATIAVSTFAGSASARQVSGGGNSQGAAQDASGNGLAGVNVAVGVQDALNNLCVAALTSTGCT